MPKAREVSNAMHISTPYIVGQCQSESLCISVLFVNISAKTLHVGMQILAHSSRFESPNSVTAQ